MFYCIFYMEVKWTVDGSLSLCIEGQKQEEAAEGQKQVTPADPMGGVT